MRPRRTIAAALVAALTFASLAHATVTPVVLDDDHGGSIDTFIMWYKRLRASGTPVIIRGICESACTFVLMLPREQVCVEPTGSLGFHLATVNDRAEPDVTDAIIRRWYPEAVRKWLATKKLRAVPVYMDAKTIVSLGIFPSCEPELS